MSGFLKSMAGSTSVSLRTLMVGMMGGWVDTPEYFAVKVKYLHFPIRKNNVKKQKSYVLVQKT